MNDTGFVTCDLESFLFIKSGGTLAEVSKAGKFESLSKVSIEGRQIICKLC